MLCSYSFLRQKKGDIFIKAVSFMGELNTVVVVGSLCRTVEIFCHNWQVHEGPWSRKLLLPAASSVSNW